MKRIREVSFDTDLLTLVWDDDSESHLLAIWLRDHCQMPASRDPTNGQRLLNITDLPIDVEIDRVELVGQNLSVRFKPDGHHSLYPQDWLFENCYCRNQHYDDRSAANKTLWQASSFDRGLPRQSYPNYCQHRDIKMRALQSVKDYGFVILGKVPCESGRVLEVIDSFGFVRHTNYGALFEVRAKIDPNNLAYTNLGLGCHLDNPYRDPVPGLQLLHCLESSVDGGDSILLDGFMAATLLRNENPEHFNILNQHWINFRFRDDTADLRSRAALIETNDRGDIIKIRFNNRSIDTIKLPPQTMRQFYAAYRHFAEILERKHLQIQFHLQVGELVLFDNTRILHARSAFTSACTRHFQGAYSDLDGLYSCLAKLQQVS